MTTNLTGAVIEFPEWFEDRVEMEMTDKGYLSGLVVRLPDGARYPVNFIDPVRLRQDLENDTSAGTRYFTEPGLVVIPEVTMPAIRATVERLVEDRFFSHLKPLPPSPPSTHC